MSKKQKKRFVVRKYIMARNAKEAIEKDSKTQVDDVWVDEKWMDENKKHFSDAIGFTIETEDND